MATPSKGTCYLCGREMSKGAFPKHLASHPADGPEAQACVLLKVEDAEDRNYWLYVDLPPTASLKSLDGFLRKIWLECCGHMSAFYTRRMEQIGMATKLQAFSRGDVLRYEYDFGSTTELKITLAGQTTRPRHRAAVRLLARNQPPSLLCGQCGRPADWICTERMYSSVSPFFCKECAQAHGHEDLLPVTNSPRMGVCGYCGDLDCYEFEPEKVNKD